MIFLAVAMLGLILFMRLIFTMRERRHERFLAVWRPVFARGLTFPNGNIPTLKKYEMPYFAALFIRYHSLVGGEEKENLNAMARAAGLRGGAAEMLISRSVSKQLQAIAALGCLKEQGAIDRLARYAAGEHTLLSLAAAVSMVRIDPSAAVRKLMPLIVSRRDWAASSVYRILREAGPDAVSGVLLHAVMRADEETALRLMPFLGTADAPAAAAAVRFWLDKTTSDEMIAACLKMVSSPLDAPVARRYIGHPAWFVRAQAALLLGKIGGREDVPSLVTLLADKEWWVRYRAAQALADLPFLGAEGLHRIMAGQRDRFAKDILFQVMSEKGI